MGFLDHIRACNTYREERFRPLVLDGEWLGRVRHDNAERLRRFPAVFAVGDAAVEIVAPRGFDALTEAVDEVIEALVAEGEVEKWRHEFFAVAPRWRRRRCSSSTAAPSPSSASDPTASISTGCGRDGGGLELWIGKRAADKKIAPDKLDNMVAGGIGFGHGAFETLVKEAAEEAAHAAPIASPAPCRSAPSPIAWRCRTGMRDDVLFLYDLDVPADFVPRNTDGEIAEFRLMPVARMPRARARDRRFQVQRQSGASSISRCATAMLTADMPDYLELATGLRRPLAAGPYRARRIPPSRVPRRAAPGARSAASVGALSRLA